MTTFTNILVPVDYEAPADAALRVAGDLARAAKGRLLVTHALPLPIYTMAEYPIAPVDGGWIREETERLRTHVRAVLERDEERGRSSAAYFEAMVAGRDDVRAALARVLHAPPEDVALTSSTTEGCNVVVNGLGIGAGDEVVTTDSEHPGLFGALVASGADLRVVPVRDLPPEGLDPALTPDLRRVLFSLEAILRLHLAQEDEIYDAVAT